MRDGSWLASKNRPSLALQGEKYHRKVSDMPRQARIREENSIYHIIQRGNEKKNIFSLDDDKSKFLDILQKMKEKYNFLIYGYCIMDNYVHLIINDNDNDISKLMKSINISYAFYYNHVYDRCGHLFQDRFKSQLITNDSYLLQLSKYIHNNPVKAGLAKKAEDYGWSSFNTYIQKAENKDGFVDVNKVLGIYSNLKDRALKQYVRFVEEEEKDFDVLDFAEDLISDEQKSGNFISTKEQGQEKIKMFLESRDLTFERMIKDLILRNELIKDIRKNSSLSLKQIGELFDGISESGISRILSDHK